MDRASLTRQSGGNPPESQVSGARLTSRPFKRWQSRVCYVSPVAVRPPRGPLRGLRPLQDLSEKERQICSFVSSDLLFLGCQSFSRDLFATLHLTQLLPTEPTPPFPGSATLAGWVLWSAWPLGVSMEGLWPLLLQRRKNSLIRRWDPDIPGHIKGPQTSQRVGLDTARALAGRAPIWE